MLENAALRLERVDGALHWLILEADGGGRLGLARQGHGFHWLRWLSWPTLVVSEGDDESLLFTLDRGIGPLSSHVVHDADRRLVGWLRGTLARDALGQLVARQELAGTATCWRGPDGAELVAICPGPDATLVRFDPACASPFLRMLLLADALRSAR